MDRAQEFIDNFLAHGSQFYDPAKAHEYYLKTRDLKGRRSAGQLKSKKKKEAWAYVQSQVAAKNKTDVKTASVAQTAKTKQIHATAQARQKELADKLKGIMHELSLKHQAESKKLTADRKNESVTLTDAQKRESKRISDDATAKLAALPPIPKGLTKEAHAKAAADRAAEVQRIRGEATNQRNTLMSGTKQNRASLSADTKAQRQGLTGGSRADALAQRASATQERKKVAADLKATVANAQKNYKALRENLKNKYQATLDKEFQAIKTGSFS